MNVTIYGPDLKKKAILYHFVSLLWQPRYNTPGSFCVELVSDPSLLGVIEPMDYVTTDADEAVMIVLSVEFDAKKFVIRGQSADYVLSTRVSNTVIKNRNAEEAMRELVSAMPPYPGVSLGESAGYPDKFTAQVSDQSVQSYCGVIARSVGMGFRLRKSGDALLFEVYKPGVNTAVKFSAALGNLTGERYAVSVSGYANVAIVAGQGTGDERITVIAGDTSAEGINRREIYVDARNEQQEEGETPEEYEARLVRYGETKLEEHRKMDNSQFSLDSDALRLGDLVYVTPSYSGKTVLARVISLAIKCQNNTIKKTAVVDIAAAESEA